MENDQEEWTRYQVILPEDDFDEDDEIDARIEKAERFRRNHVVRGGLRGV
jgi:hypothetical protein